MVEIHGDLAKYYSAQSLTFESFAELMDRAVSYSPSRSPTGSLTWQSPHSLQRPTPLPSGVREAEIEGRGGPNEERRNSLLKSSGGFRGPGPTID